ncbi:hypothetical protein BJV82DRAFT_661401 [Fennellomyces sp. T-0311]|nr:hypothetical protein BJV82DRAFT_661401 [Fennellomyces sp. T-0311]
MNDFYDLEEIKFCEQALMPYIEYTFPAKEVFTIEGPSLSSKACKFEGVDSSLVALKPHVIVSRDQSEYVAGGVTKPDHKYFGVYTGLPKLGFELKYMLDHLITADPCKEVAVTGILLEDCLSQNDVTYADNNIAHKDFKEDVAGFFVDRETSAHLLRQIRDIVTRNNTKFAHLKRIFVTVSPKNCLYPSTRTVLSALPQLSATATLEPPGV